MSESVTLQSKDGKYKLRARGPTRHEYNRFLATASEPKKRGQALEDLVRDCAAPEDRPKLDAMLDEKPALSAVFAEVLLEMAGVGIEAEKKDSSP